MSCLAALLLQDGLLWFHWWVILSEQSILACYARSAFPMNKFIYNLQIPYSCLVSGFELWLGTGWETSGCSGLGVYISKSNCLDICYRSWCSSAEHVTWEMNFFMAGLIVNFSKKFCIVVLYANSLKVLCIANPTGLGNESLWQNLWQENTTRSDTWLPIEVSRESATCSTQTFFSPLNMRMYVCQ